MDYKLIRSRRKTITVQVTKELVVVVRAPIMMKEKDIGRFLDRHRDWIDKAMEKQKLYQEKYPEPSEEQLAEMKLKAKAYIPGRVRYFSDIMNLSPENVKITSAKTRFGSCSGKNSLCFSCRLMAYPAEAIDYVIVHELAHIVHKNHSKAFYDLVARYLPDYKDRNKLLKKTMPTG